MHPTPTPTPNPTRRRHAHRRTATLLLASVVGLTALAGGASALSARAQDAGPEPIAVELHPVLHGVNDRIPPTDDQAPGADETASPDDVGGGPAARILAQLDEAGASTTEHACVSGVVDTHLDGEPALKAAVGCLGMDTMVAIDRHWLDASTEATPTQLGCVADRWRDHSEDAVRALVVDGGAGQEIYMPCGLPD